MPKKYLITTCFALLFLLSSFVLPQVTNYNKGGIVFFKGTWASVLQKAKAENKTIFLSIGASWCGPCHKMKAKTFTNTKVGAYFNANFINVSLDGEDGEDGTMLSDKFKLAYYPSLYLIDANGSVLKAGSGYYNGREILQFGKSVVK